MHVPQFPGWERAFGGYPIDMDRLKQRAGTMLWRRRFPGCEVATALLRLQYTYSGSLEPWLHWRIEVPDCGAVSCSCVCRASGI